MTVIRTDLRSTQSFISGAWKCRGELDLVLSSSGDIALMPTAFDDLGQRLLFWLAMPRGELVESSWGSELIDWFHEPLTDDNLIRFENQLVSALLADFPYMKNQIVSIAASKVDRGAIMIHLILTDGGLVYTFTRDEVVDFMAQLENLEVFYG